MSNNISKSTARETRSSFFRRLMRIVLTTVVSLCLIVGAFVAYDSKFWRYFQYQNKEGFYFEKYRTTEEAEKALNEIYPVGTSVLQFASDLKEKKAWLPTGNKVGSPDTYWYHSNDDSWFFSIAWRVKIWYSVENELIRLEVDSYLNQK